MAPVVPFPNESPIGVINAGRAARGVPPFAIDVRLTRAAQGHADNMAYGRVGFGHGGFPDRVYRAGYSRYSPISEGVFALMPEYGYDVRYWVNFMVVNPGETHGAHFGDPRFRFVGIGLGSGPAGHFLCLDYGG